MPIGKNGNGLALLERFIPDGVSHAVTAFVESLKINTISEKRRRGRLVVIKRRNIFGERGAHFYFRVAGVTILPEQRAGLAAMGGELLPNAKRRSVSREDHRRTDGLSG
ncbi:MAG TPA: hypothetical protein VNN24_09545 [Candidatus Binatus sp.]|nr:hypothetical protein [Candidatus Binatus sp.]